MGEEVAAPSSCAALWPAPACFWGGHCDASAAPQCVCGPGWSLGNVEVEGARLCVVPEGGVVQSLYRWWAAMIALNTLIVTPAKSWVRQVHARFKLRGDRLALLVDWASGPFFFACAWRGSTDPGHEILASSVTYALFCTGLFCQHIGKGHEARKRLRFAMTESVRELTGMHAVASVRRMQLVAVAAPSAVVLIAWLAAALGAPPAVMVARLTCALLCADSALRFQVNRTILAPIKRVLDEVFQAMSESKHTSTDLLLSIRQAKAELESLCAFSPCLVLTPLLVSALVLLWPLAAYLLGALAAPVIFALVTTVETLAMTHEVAVGLRGVVALRRVRAYPLDGTSWSATTTKPSPSGEAVASTTTRNAGAEGHTRWPAEAQAIPAAS
jgi:hypothetical protein